MVDGGRCSCQDDLEEGGGDPPPPCCSAHVFTSVLLGILACVLMTGGVFLAFHRWDPLWLIVSGIGVLLILIGSILHCCSDAQDNSRARHRGPAGKGGCCGGRPEHHGHNLVLNNGSLTEQLLPLSNARSVSQLSLNMLPGYFPPVVATYGIEQHSAAVQNISRLVQQQSPAPGSPGVQSSGGGKFILVLPGSDPSQQQNLVGYTLYQLDESSTTGNPGSEAAPTTPLATSTVPSSPKTLPFHPPLYKSVEVQTCHVWPSNGSNNVPNSSSENNSNNSSNSSSGIISNNSPNSPLESNSNNSKNTSNSDSTERTPQNECMQNAACGSSLAESAIIQNSHFQKKSSSKFNSSQNPSSSNSTTDVTPSDIVGNNKPSTVPSSSDIKRNNHKQKSSYRKSNNSQKASSSNSAKESTSFEATQNNKPLQNASCCTESVSSDSIQINLLLKSSSRSSSIDEPTSSKIAQNNKPLPNDSGSISALQLSNSIVMQNNDVQKSSCSNSSTNTPNHNSFQVSQDINFQNNSSGTSCAESVPSESNPRKKTPNINESSSNSVAEDHQIPSTSRTESVGECCTVGIPICDNSKSTSISDMLCVQSATTLEDNQHLENSRTLEDSQMVEASSLGSSGESLLVVAIPETSTDIVNHRELATPLTTTDSLVEVGITSTDVHPESTEVFDPSGESISADNLSLSETSVDVPVLSADFIEDFPTSSTSADVLSTSTTTTDVLPTPTVPADDPIYDVLPARIIATNVPTVLIDIGNASTSSSGIASTSDSTQQATSDITNNYLQVGVGCSDLSLSNLSDMDGEVDDSELLERFSPPPSYDDAVNEGESAIGAFGLAYGTI